MKLLRVGAPGAEKPAIMAADGSLRDLSGHVADIDGAALSPAGLAKIAAIDAASLPLQWRERPRIGAVCGAAS